MDAEEGRSRACRGGTDNRDQALAAAAKLGGRHSRSPSADLQQGPLGERLWFRALLHEQGDFPMEDLRCLVAISAGNGR